nr:hypothetical protein [Angustibacter aerolatus]
MKVADGTEQGWSVLRATLTVPRGETRRLELDLSGGRRMVHVDPPLTTSRTVVTVRPDAAR